MAELRIYDHIGLFGVTAEGVARQFDQFGNGDVDIRISSPGGDVLEGFAIHSVIARHPGRTTAYIDGEASSAASFIAMAADEVVISPYGRMMIHDAWVLAAGDARQLRKGADVVDGLSATIAQIYADRAGGGSGVWRDAMLAETWYDPQQAVSAGLADRIGDTPHGTRQGGIPSSPDLTQAVAVAAARRRRNQRILTPQKGP